jgi:hypothetical protein
MATRVFSMSAPLAASTVYTRQNAAGVISDDARERGLRSDR